MSGQTPGDHGLPAGDGLGAGLSNEGVLSQCPYHISLTIPKLGNIVYLTRTSDIEELYEIVRLAQTLPGPPLRALFTAYDRVRAERNTVDDGSRYFTFLVRMQEDAARERGGEKEGLVERFQRELAKMGIHVEIDPEGEGVEVMSALESVGTSQQGVGMQSMVPPGAYGARGTEHTRRGSLDSFLDGSADKVPGVEYGELTHPSRGGSDVGDRRDFRRSISESEARGTLFGHPPIRGRMNGYENTRYGSGNLQHLPRRARSISTQGSLRIYRDGHTSYQQPGDYEGDESEQTSDSFDRSHVQIPGVNVPLPEPESYGSPEHAIPVPSYHPSDLTMLRDAETFVYHKNFALKRAYIVQWRNKAHAHHEQHQEMQRAAIAFDRNILLRASLDSWRIALQNKHASLETDRFFERWEKRAEKARNLFLLTKAFTHWAKCAEDEVLRTSTARRHILRTKYFNAWREITAVNELKIQHFVLAKFLDKWRAKTADARQKSDTAVALYESNLMERVYQQWWWKFAERTAPQWHNDRLARLMLRKLAEIAQVLKERQEWAAAQRDVLLMRRAFTKLQEKVSTYREQEQQADEFCRSALLSQGFHALRTRSKLAPLEKQVSQKVDQRALKTTLATWHKNTQLARTARQHVKQRIMKSAFQTWNDRLRINELQHHINVRIQLECLCKWTLASRVLVFQRVHNRRLKESVFALWRSKTVETENALDRAERRFGAWKRKQVLQSCLASMESKTVQRRDTEFAADELYAERLKRRILIKLQEKYRHLEKLGKWADKANYYVTAKHALSKWTTATDYARRGRRRDAYATVRRNYKLGLVRKMWGIWRDKSARLTEAQREAEELDSRHVRGTALVLLQGWHDRTQNIGNLTIQAVNLHADKLLHQSLGTWVDRTQLVQQLDTDAAAFKNESAAITAAGLLKKLEWRVWMVRRQEENAQALRERNFEKHVRAMMRFWAEEAIARVAAREVDDEEGNGSPSPARRRRDGDDQYDGGARDEEIDEGDEGYGGGGGAGLAAGRTGGKVSTPPHQQVDDTFVSGDATQRLEAWTPFNERDLDLSFSVSPDRTGTQMRPRAQRPTAPTPAPTRASVARRLIASRLQPQTEPRGSGALALGLTPRTQPRQTRTVRTPFARITGTGSRPIFARTRSQDQTSSVLRPSFPTPITEENSQASPEAPIQDPRPQQVPQDIDEGARPFDASALDINETGLDNPYDNQNVQADAPANQSFWTSADTPMPLGPRSRSAQLELRSTGGRLQPQTQSQRQSHVRASSLRNAISASRLPAQPQSDLPLPIFSSTTAPPPTSAAAAPKPGYLRTPSKRSVVRERLLPGRVGEGLGVGVARSAPPGLRFGTPAAPAMAGLGEGTRGVRSFESRLREEGYVHGRRVGFR